MNSQAIQSFVMRYLEAQQCQVIEKRPTHVTVKLSPAADRDLTNRSYYWNFIERTGAEAETMTFTFIFDKEAMEQNAALTDTKSPSSGSGTAGQASQGGRYPSTTSGAAPNAPTAAYNPNLGTVSSPAASPGSSSTSPQGTPPTTSILATYFGIDVGPATGRPGSRIPQEELTYGSRRLEQIFGSVRKKGKFVQLFEEPTVSRSKKSSTAYTSWLCMNYKLEFVCDMKRDELHSLGIRLSDGAIVEHFHNKLTGLSLTPRLPATVHLQRNNMPLHQAVQHLELHLSNKVKQYDHRWAVEAQQRMEEEMARVQDYYEKLLPTVEEDQSEEVQQQYRLREQEVGWQYKPRIEASVINCGLFHMLTDLSAINDVRR